MNLKKCHPLFILFSTCFCLALGDIIMSDVYAEEDTVSGLVGNTEQIIISGKTAPNGYYFEASHPHFTGFVSFRGSLDGILGIRNTKGNGGYGSWEMRPEVKLPPGGPYHASVSVKHSEFPSIPLIAIEIYSFNAKGQPTLLTHILHNNKINNEWHTIGGTFNVPSDSVRLRVRLDLTCQGEVFFKDLRVGVPQTSNAAPVALKNNPPDWRNNYLAVPQAVNSATIPVTKKFFDGKNITKNIPYSCRPGKKSTDFYISGEAGTQNAMSWENNFKIPVILENIKYYTLKYREKGVMRTAPVSGVVQLKGVNKDNQKTVLNLLDTVTAINDGEFHTIIGKIPENMIAQGLQITLKTTDSEAQIELADLQFHETLPLTVLPENRKNSNFDFISLAPQYNFNLNDLYNNGLKTNGILQETLPDFKNENIVFEGIPFKVAVNGKNLIKPPYDDSKNKETFTLVHQTVSRKFAGPVSRADKIIIPVNKKSREAYLLAFGINPHAQIRFAQPYRPLRLDDMENFHVEMIYADGTKDKAFPYSLGNKAFSLTARTADVFAIPLNQEKTLKELILHYNSWTVDFYPAALTLATDGRMLDFIRKTDAPAIQLASQMPLPQKAAVKIANKKLIAGKYVFDLSNGFSTVKIPVGKMHPASGILVKVGENTYTGRSFIVTSAAVRNNVANLTLKGNADGIRDIELSLKLSSGKTGDIIWNGSVKNLGTKNINIIAAIGNIKNFQLGNVDDDYVFFPRFRAEVSNKNASYRSAYGMEFMHMFFDFFNSKIKKGMTVICDNRNSAKNEYRAAKTNDGMSGFVNLQQPFCDLKPKQIRNLSPIIWQVHNGDWHSAMAIYKKFLNNFYKPFKAQNKDFFLNNFDDTCYHTGDLCRRWWQMPPLMSKDKSKHYINEYLDFDLKLKADEKPGFAHLWWHFDEKEDRMKYGHWSSDAFYNMTGGLKNFRELIRCFQQDKGIPVSLYTLSDRFTNKDVPAFLRNKDRALMHPNGSFMANDIETYTCFEDNVWVDWVVKDLTKLMKDTGASVIYSDVVCSFNGTRCYNPAHGHAIPSNSVKGDINFLSKLRKSLPDNKAIWTEYGLPDSASMYADGYISYYFMELNEYFGPALDRSDMKNFTEFDAPFTASRYLLPHYKVHCAAVGIEAGNKPSQVKYSFFNGDVLGMFTWFLFESNSREHLNRANKIKKAYKDCFLTKTPEVRVQTLINNVYSNKFPGKNRTVWTFYNAAPVSREGKMIAIPHKPGAVYRDIWNNKILTPEIKNNKAFITLSIAPQDVGAIVQEMTK